jgi:hypothetical protein
VDAWSNRIKALLSVHFVQVFGFNGLWIVQVANEGQVIALPAGTEGPFEVKPH